MIADYVAATPEVWQRDGNFVLFSAQTGDTKNIWRIPISPDSGKATGEPERLTSGASREDFPSGAPGHRVAFCSLNYQIDVWSLPVDADSGKPTGDLRRLTNDVADDIRPSISRDGKKLVFLSDRSGNNDVWLKNLESGKETALTTTRMPETRVKISGDGSRVVYNQAVPNQQPTIYVVSAQGGVSKNVCGDCGIVLGASSDGNIITYWPGGTPIHLFTVEVESGRKTEILSHDVAGRYGPVFSPDTRWLTFSSGVGSGPSKVIVAPFRAGAPIPESDWIVVADELASVNQPNWSPNGNVIYFLSDIDGGRCIWAQRLDPVTKRPVGQRFEIGHFDRARLSPNNVNNIGDVSLTVARDKLVFSMGELTGNIWMAESR